VTRAHLPERAATAAQVFMSTVRKDDQIMIAAKSLTATSRKQQQKI
jgi:hypothetical protein